MANLTKPNQTTASYESLVRDQEIPENIWNLVIDDASYDLDNRTQNVEKLALKYLKNVHDARIASRSVLLANDAEYMFSDSGNGRANRTLMFALQHNQFTADALVGQLILKARFGLVANLRFFPYKSSDLMCTILIIACMKGYVSTVRHILASPKLMVSVRNTDALSNACVLGNVEIVEALCLDSRIDPTATRCMPLYLACRNGKTDVVRILLRHERMRHRLQTVPIYATRALCEAARTGRVRLMKLLLKDDLFDPSINDNAVLFSAICGNSTNIVRDVLKDPRVDPTGYITTKSSFLTDGLSTSQTLGMTTRRRSVGKSRTTMLVHACELGNVLIVSMLLHDRRVDPSELENRALVVAARNNNSHILRLLLFDPRVNPHGFECRALTAAIAKGNVEIARQIIRTPGMSHEQYNLAIEICSGAGVIDCVQALLANSTGRLSRTNRALDMAVYFKHSILAGILMKDGRFSVSGNGQL